MIQVPYEFKGLREDIKCEILGWEGNKLKLRITPPYTIYPSNIFLVRRSYAKLLLKEIGLQESDIPTDVVKYPQEKKWDGWDAAN